MHIDRSLQVETDEINVVDLIFDRENAFWALEIKGFRGIEQIYKDGRRHRLETPLCPDIRLFALSESVIYNSRMWPESPDLNKHTIAVLFNGQTSTIIQVVFIADGIWQELSLQTPEGRGLQAPLTV